MKKLIKHKAICFYLDLKNLALDKGFIRGNQDYVRFIILGRSRTGSAFLRALLNSHSQITTFGEIFRDPEAIGWGLPGYSQSRKALSFAQTQPIDFLETRIFRKYPKLTSAVGFKIFYYHAHSKSWKDVWAYLKSQQDIRIIHMKRANILETHLSRKRAGLTNIWEADQSQKRLNIDDYNQPISLNYEECLEDFIRTRKWESEYDAFFQNHLKIEIEYEDLAQNTTGEMKKILDFLGTRYEELKPATTKQSRLTLSQAISNYNELKEKFKETPWFEFFDD
jgi:LPS sulfotransferase NodH